MRAKEKIEKIENLDFFNGDNSDNFLLDFDYCFVECQIEIWRRKKKKSEKNTPKSDIEYCERIIKQKYINCLIDSQIEMRLSSFFNLSSV